VKLQLLIGAALLASTTAMAKEKGILERYSEPIPGHRESGGVRQYYYQAVPEQELRQLERERRDAKRRVQELENELHLERIRR
jgi:hypothetical protein